MKWLEELCGASWDECRNCIGSLVHLLGHNIILNTNEIGAD